jgi:hypothetical protein
MARICQWGIKVLARGLLVWFFSSILLMAAVSPGYAQTAKPSIIDQCAGLLADDRSMPEGANAPSIRIVSPADNEVLYGNEIVITVETQHFDFDAGAGHWHLWVNGQLMGMLYQSSGVVDLAPGTYQICASMGGADHRDLGMPDGITVTVQQPAAGTPLPTLAVARESAPVLTEPGISLLQIILIGGLGVLAALGGWWLGARLPKRRQPKD